MLQRPTKKARKIDCVFDDLQETSKRTDTVPVQALPAGSPARWSRLVGNKPALRTLQNHAKSISNKFILLHGPTGIGKTAACRLVFRKVAWIHDIRSIGFPLLARLDRLIKSKRHYPQEVVVLDPIEEVMAMRGIQDAKKLCAIVERAIQKKSGLGFVVVSDNIYTRAMYPIRCHAKLNTITLRMYALRKNEVRTLLVNAGIMHRQKLHEGIAVAAGDGRKAVQYARGGSHSADYHTLNKFKLCEAVVAGDTARARATDNPRAFLGFWEANLPQLTLGHQNKDPTTTDLDTYSHFLECASFADLTTTKMRNHGYAMELTLACAKTRRLHDIPMGKAVYPNPPLMFHQNRTPIHQKCKMMGVRPRDLHDHVHLLQQSLRMETNASKLVQRTKQIDSLHKQWGASAEIGQLSLEMQFAKKQSRQREK